VIATRHLSSAELVDLAEAARPESSAPHLAECDRCRRELASLRRSIADAAAVGVPEPSPLFWDHLSVRIHDAVAAEASRVRSRASWLQRFVPPVLHSPVVLWPAAVLAVVAIAVGVRTPSYAPAPGVSAGTAESSTVTGAAADDPALRLVAQMAGALDEEGASALTPVDVTAHPGVVEETVNGMSQSEREELGRLITEAMRRPGP
jgi:hypothetical protein